MQLNAPTKSHWVAELIRKKRHTYDGYNRLTMSDLNSHTMWEHGKKIVYVDENWEEVVIAILLSSKIDFETNTSKRKKRALYKGIQSVSQFSHSVVSNFLWPHELQHARPPYPSPTQYADDTTLMAESEELKSLLKVKEESETVGLKLNIQKTKIMASSRITS